MKRQRDLYENPSATTESTKRAHGSHCSPQGRPKGLIQLKDFSKSQESVVLELRLDVVALHGLNGHVVETWKSDDIVWFRDLLPSHVPEIDFRVSSFGYSSEVFSGSKSQMLDFALSLLNSLDTLRTSTYATTVPILFICHSLGGILVKKCLALAQERQKLYGDIKSSTIGVVFFGTPHAGSDIARWTRVIRDIANAATFGNARSDLIKNLERRSGELAELAASSVERLEELQIISVYERKPLGALGLIVGRESALLHLPNERPMPVEADHRNVCRFSSAEDPQFRPVILAIVDLIRSAVVRKPRQFYEDCLASLYFNEFQERRLIVGIPHEETFSWVWSHDSFREWADSNQSALLWLQGKPASGKSTITNYLRNGLQRYLDQRDSSTKNRHVIADFFYSLRGGTSQHQRGHTWMLRSILWQLLASVPNFWADFCEFHEQKTLSQGLKAGLPLYELNFRNKIWTLEELQSVLVNLGSNYPRVPRLTVNILVDAMDESDRDERRKIVSSLLHVGNHDAEWPVTFKVFIASRPDPVFNIVSNKCIFMLLEDETSGDIRTFVDGELKRIVQGVPSLGNGNLAFVRQELIRKCQGVFLWAKLVLLELENKAHEEGCTIREMEELLVSIPSDLEDLYDRMRVGLASQTMLQEREVKAIFQWAAYAPQPLTLFEMREVAAAAACGGNQLTELEMSRNRVADVNEIKRRIISRCGNFLEVKSRQEDPTGLPEIVQFIHTTALQYLTNLPSDERISISDSKAAKLAIADLCVGYTKFVLSAFPKWMISSSQNLIVSVQNLREVDIKPPIDFLSRYKPSLLKYILTAEKKTIRSLARKRFLEAWKLGSLGVFALYLSSVIQNNADTLKIIENSQIPEILDTKLFGLEIRQIEKISLEGFLETHDVCVVLSVDDDRRCSTYDGTDCYVTARDLLAWFTRRKVPRNMSEHGIFGKFAQIIAPVDRDKLLRDVLQRDLAVEIEP